MTFYRWLKKQVREDSVIGDLAEDVMRDPQVTPDMGIRAIRAYLSSKPSYVREALKEAYEEYSAYYL